MNSILAGKEGIVFGGLVSSNQFDLNLGYDGENNDYVDSFLWGHTSAPSSPSYDLQAQANLNAGACTSSAICGRGSLGAFNLPTPGVPAAGFTVIDWQEIFP